VFSQARGNSVASADESSGYAAGSALLQPNRPHALRKRPVSNGSRLTLQGIEQAGAACLNESKAVVRASRLPNRGSGGTSPYCHCVSQFFFCGAGGLIVWIGGFFVCAAGGPVVPICGVTSGGVRRNRTGPFSLPLEITASNNFGSALG